MDFVLSARINCVSTLFILRWRWKKLYEIDFFLSTNKVLIKKDFLREIFIYYFLRKYANYGNTFVSTMLWMLCTFWPMESASLNVFIKKILFYSQSHYMKKKFWEKTVQDKYWQFLGSIFYIFTWLPPPALTPRWGFDHWVSYGKNIKMVQNGQYFVFVLLNTVINFTKDSIR